MKRQAPDTLGLGIRIVHEGRCKFVVLQRRRFTGAKSRARGSKTQRSCHLRLRLHDWHHVASAGWFGFRVLERCGRCGRFSVADVEGSGVFAGRFRRRVGPDEAWRLIDRAARRAAS